MAPEVTGVPVDTNETVIVVPPLELPGTTTIDVFAENNVDHNLYTVNFEWAVGIGKNAMPAISVYPNPVSDRVFISGADHARISLYSPTGIPILTVEDFTGTILKLPGLSKGVYILKIEHPENRVMQKKIVVM